MHVLIVEDDRLMADLIATLVRQLKPTVVVHTADTVAEAVEQWRRHRPAVIICDWHLRGAETGDALVKTVRNGGDKATILMVTGQSSRQWVARMIRLGVDNYLTKPFTPSTLIERMRPYFSSDEPKAESPPVPLSVWLADIDAVLSHLSDQVAQYALADDYDTLRALSASELEVIWQEHAGLSERLIRSANQLLYSGTGRAVSTVRDAIAVMGVDQAVNLAFALSVSGRHSVPVPLGELHERLSDQSRRVAEEASRLAGILRRDRTLAYTAGLLHNLGEMTVLAAIGWYQEHLAAVDTTEAERLVNRWAPDYGNRLRVKWRLPLQLREMMGAAHRLPDDHQTQDMLIIRLAALLANNEPVSEPVKRLARQAGLSEYALIRRPTTRGGPLSS